jgi:AcrR family transcriptional regulator
MSKSTGEPTSRRERRKERTRRHLLEAAERLFRSKGYDATTVEEIATAADVAKGTFFNYFDNKASLLSAILYARIYPLLVSPPGEGRAAPERIQLFLEALWTEIYPYRHIARRMLVYALSQAESNPPPEESHQPSRTLTCLIQLGQAQGFFRTEVEAELMGRLIATQFFLLFVSECDKVGTANVCWQLTLEENLSLLYHGLMVK